MYLSNNYNYTMDNFTVDPNVSILENMCNFTAYCASRKIIIDVDFNIVLKRLGDKLKEVM